MKKETLYRKNGFLRGIGEGSWHDKENWNFSDHTKRQDKFNYKQLGIQSVRSWAFHPSDKSLQTHWETYHTTIAGTVNMATTNGSRLQNGMSCAENFFKDGLLEETKEKLSYLAEFKKLDAMECILLGNEQTYLCQDEQGNYCLAGFDEDAQRAFKFDWLPSRFGDIERFNSLCNTEYESFEQVNATENDRTRIEFWFFLRNGFESLLENTVSELKAKNPALRFGYAKFMSRRNPTADDAYLRFMDYGCQNLYWQWYRDTLRYSVRMDELIGSLWGRPCLLTEYGIQNMFHLEGQRKASRYLRQHMMAMYMRPAIHGLELFCYSGQFEAHNLRDPEYSWGITWPNRNKKLSFYAVKEIYNNFEKLDKLFDGDMHCTPLLAITNQLIDELQNKVCTTDKICRALYANGVPVRFLTGDSSQAIDSCNTQSLLLADTLLWQKPDGSYCVANALMNYLKRNKNNKIISLSEKPPIAYYNYSNEITAKKWETIEHNLGGQIIHRTTNPLDCVEVWNTLAPFIHRDFISDNFIPECNEANESMIRILDTATFCGNFHWDEDKPQRKSNQRWEIQQQLVFSKNKAYLFIINTGDSHIDTVEVTLGIRKEIQEDWFPEMICSGSDAVVFDKQDFNQPCWLKSISPALKLRTIVIHNLDTYSVIELGEFKNNLKGDQL